MLTHRRGPLDPDLYDGLTSRDRVKRRQAARAFLEQRLPSSWTTWTIGKGSRWTAYAEAPDGRRVMASGGTFAGASIALAKRLANPDAAASPVKPQRAGRRNNPWIYPLDIDAFLELVSPGDVDEDTRRRDVARWFERHPGFHRDVPDELKEGLRARRLWLGQGWPEGRERTSLERIETDARRTLPK